MAGNLTIDLVEESGHRRNGAKRAQAALRLTVVDDGKGIDPSTSKGFGLTTMTERVKSLGGPARSKARMAKAPQFASKFRCNARKRNARERLNLSEECRDRVLVIDDHPIVLQGCRQLLEDAGVENIVQAQPWPTASAFTACKSPT